MRLTRFIVILAMSFMFAQWAVAGFPPVRIGGILQSLVTKFTLLFPAKSVVNRGGVTAYIDTDVSNLLHDGSFEGIALSSDWSLSGGTATFETADKVDGNQALRITASASTPILRQTVSTKSGLPLVVGCMVKTDQNFVEICAKDNTTDVLCTNVPSDNTWRFLKFPIVAGNDGGIEVRSSQNITGNIDVDKCRVEYSDTTQDIAQAEYIGSLTYIGSNNCLWSTSSATFSNFAANNNCNNPIVTGELQPTATKIPAFKLPSVKVGTYRVIANSLFYISSGAFAVFRITDGVNNFGYAEAQDSNTNQSTDIIDGSITYNTPLSDVTFQIQARVNGTALVSPNAPERPLRFDVYYYPPKTKIVTQLQEETVQTANEFSAKISNNGTIISENLDWISGTTCPIVGVNRRCTLNDLGITYPMACVVSAENVDTTQANQIEAEFEAITTTYIDYNMTISGVGNNNIQASIKCQKQSPDYNKSRMVYGQFEQIKSGVMTIVEASGNVGTGIGSGIDIPFTNETTDNKNAWNGTVFTAPEDGYYIVDGSVFLTNNVQFAIFATKNGSHFRQINQVVLSNVHQFDTTIYLDEGETFSVRASAAATVNNNAVYHYITIKKSPDLESLVKNLNPSNVKCQTKYLSANTSSIGVLPDLTFTNLTIGKSYSVNFKHSISWTATQAANNVNLEYGDGTDIEPSTLGGYHNINNMVQSVGIAIKRLPITQTTLQFNLTTSSTSQLLGNGTRFRTYAEVCELPDNYIETTEF